MDTVPRAGHNNAALRARLEAECLRRRRAEQDRTARANPEVRRVLDAPVDALVTLEAFQRERAARGVGGPREPWGGDEAALTRVTGPLARKGLIWTPVACLYLGPIGLLCMPAFIVLGLGLGTLVSHPPDLNFVARRKEARLRDNGMAELRVIGRDAEFMTRPILESFRDKFLAEEDRMYRQPDKVLRLYRETLRAIEAALRAADEADRAEARRTVDFTLDAMGRGEAA